MPRKQQGWITFQTSSEERQRLEQYCLQTQRSKTEVLRELVRKLTSDATGVPEMASVAIAPNDCPQQPEPLPALKVSTRNVFRGVIKRLAIGTVSAEVVLEIAPGVNLVSVITKTSAIELNLKEGKEIYALIKSNNVILAHEQWGVVSDID